MKALLVVVLVGCATESAPPSPDAAPVEQVRPDACVREPIHGCCDLLPDEAAVAQCAAATVAPGVCGVSACWQADCSLIKVPFCAPE